MKNHVSPRNSWFAPALMAGAVLALFLLAYATTRIMSSGEVMGRVEVAGTEIGGLDREQALTALIVVDDRYASRPAVFVVDKKLVSLQPTEVGFGLDTSAMVDEALTVGRSGNPFSEFWWWLSHVFKTVEIPVQGSYDDISLSEVFDTWDADVIDNPANQGAVVVEDGEIVPEYPRTGLGIDRGEAPSVVLRTLLAAEASQTEIPTSIIEAKLTDADIDAAVAEGRAMVSGDIEMVYDGASVTFTADQLLAAFQSSTEVAGSSATVTNSFDPEVVSEYLAPVREEFEDEPVDARFLIEGDTVSIVPGSSGTRIDETVTADRLAAAGLTASRRGELPVVEAAEPDTTTAELESLDVNHLVSQFTTYFPCCQPRVVNIQTMAATVDGTIVRPGETFSLNGLVGERTEEKGYQSAPTIVAGEIEDTFGGGVSQFTTTMYNAVFWGGYEDVEHRPHSYYFSRYPEGIEATLNWRTPDLQFRNNRSHAILIDTIATETSITVRFFGDNDGRTLKGEQSGGRRKVWVDAEGGPDALHVKGSVSDRYGYTEPGEPRYEPNPELDMDTQITLQEEGQGWSVTVTREILRGGTELIESREWVVRYAPKFAVYEVHPCKIPGATETCPTTTTTTLPSSTTTTTMPPTAG